MAGKKVSFGSKPSPEKTVNVEEWVANREPLVEELPKDEPKPEKMKRLTLDLPESLHKSIKLKATAEGVTMADLLRELLEEHYGNKV
ncbi:MAG TPA: CopG family transcriptional regulator [Candidatus Obscuribacterales bacterium]